MIKLTEFAAIVDTYKNNFDIRKKRYKKERKDNLKDSREKQEKRIETGKFLNVGKIANKLKPKGGGDIIDNIIKFSLLTFAGVLLSNIDKIALAAKKIFEEAKKIFKDLKVFFEEKVVPFFESLPGSIEKTGEIVSSIGDFFVDLNPFRNLSSTLSTVFNGLLGLGYKLNSLYKPPKPPNQKIGNSAVSGTNNARQVAARVRQEAARKAAIKQNALAKNKSFLKGRQTTALRSGARTQIPVLAGSGAGTNPLFGDYVKSLEETKATDRALRNAKSAISEKAKRDAAFFKSFGIDDGDKFYKAQLDQIFDDTFSDPKLKKEFLLDDLTKPTNIFSRTKASFSGLTKGLDFRFNPKDVLKFFKNPANYKSFAKGSIAGYVFEQGLKAVGTSISDALPFSENFQLLAYFGLISKERIFKLKAENIAKYPPEKREDTIKELKKSAESNPFFLDSSGLLKKEQASGILKQLAPILATMGETDLISDLKIRLQPTTNVEPSANVEPSSTRQQNNGLGGPSFPNPNKKSNENNFTIDGTKINIGDWVGSLQSDTTYSNAGLIPVNNNLIVIQPVIQREGVKNS